MIDIALSIVTLSIFGVVSFIDIKERRIPNRITYPSIITILLFLSGVGKFADSGPEYSRALIGLFFTFSLFLSLHIINPQGIGLGDVKLAALLGLTLAWDSIDALIYGIFAIFIISGIYSLILIIRNPKMISGSIPFAPFMTLGYIIGIVLK
jgi:leader peptidase (prepilin peptidase)/N-methyltransferase